MGRFRLGSTVIIVLPKDSVAWNADEVPGKRLRMGKGFGRLLK
jgi:phosphatidylserine decarboxylase